MARAPKARVPVRKEPGAAAPTRKTAGARGDLPAAAELRRTVVIEAIAPVVDGGRYPVKREVGAVFEVSADIFKEGHDVLVAFLLYRRADDQAWRETPMRFVDNDRWAGRFTLTENTRWLFTIEALADPFRSWLADLAKRVEAGQDVASELAEGVALVRAAAQRAPAGDQRDALAAYARRIEQAATQAEAIEIARDVRLAHFMDAHLDRSAATRAGREFQGLGQRGTRPV